MISSFKHPKVKKSCLSPHKWCVLKLLAAFIVPFNFFYLKRQVTKISQYKSILTV